MAIVTGVLSDFSRGALSNSSIDRSPEVWFIPSGPALQSPGSLVASRTIKTTPEVSTGAISVDLAETDILFPESWYTVVIIWLNGEGVPIGRDDLPWKMYVPSAGGQIADLIQAPWNPTLAWWGPDEPTGIPVPNTLWLDPDTGVLSIRSN